MHLKSFLSKCSSWHLGARSFPKSACCLEARGGSKLFCDSVLQFPSHFAKMEMISATDTYQRDVRVICELLPEKYFKHLRRKESQSVGQHYFHTANWERFHHLTGLPGNIHLGQEVVIHRALNIAPIFYRLLFLTLEAAETRRCRLSACDIIAVFYFSVNLEKVIHRIAIWSE